MTLRLPPLIPSRWPCSIRPRSRASRASGSSPMPIPGRHLAARPGPLTPSCLGPPTFIGDQAVANLDYNATSKDTLALKYYYQHDPTACSLRLLQRARFYPENWTPGRRSFPSTTPTCIGSNLSTQETLGFLREKLYNTNDQPFGPANIPGGSYPSASIDTFGSNYFPGRFDHPCAGRAARYRALATR